MRSMWLLLSVAVATKTANTVARSPVEKVTALLKDMQATLQAEAKEDAELYKKLTCWCENGSSEKSAAVDAAQALIAQLESEVEARGKANDEMKLEIAGRKEDTVRLQASFAAAESQRESEYKANHEEILENRANLETIKTAIYVLGQHQATSFPQIKVDFLAVRAEKRLIRNESPEGAASEADQLSRWMDEHHFSNDKKAKDVDASVLQYRVKAGQARPPVKPGQYSDNDLKVLEHAKKLVTTFMQSHTDAGVTYGTGHMGEIIGVMQQMKDDFAATLDDLEKTEKDQAEAYAGMSDGLVKAIAESERITMAKEGKAAQNLKAKADAKENLEATRTGLDADSKFLLTLRETCAAQDKTWAERTSTRNLEIKAVGEALGVLDSPDNKDLFSTSLGDGGAGFIQLKSQEHGAGIRAHAAAVLESHGGELMQLASVVRLAKFPKVIKAIDDMIGGLKDQQKEEVEHKDFCEKSLHANEMSDHEKTTSRDGAEARLEDAANQLEAVAEERAATVKALAQNLVELQEANQDRVEASQEFQKVVADQRATSRILLKVLDKLEKVYGASFVQVSPSEARMAATEAEVTKQATKNGFASPASPIQAEEAPAKVEVKVSAVKTPAKVEERVDAVKAPAKVEVVSAVKAPAEAERRVDAVKVAPQAVATPAPAANVADTPAEVAAHAAKTKVALKAAAMEAAAEAAEAEAKAAEAKAIAARAAVKEEEAEEAAPVAMASPELTVAVKARAEADAKAAADTKAAEDAKKEADATLVRVAQAAHTAAAKIESATARTTAKVAVATSKMAKAAGALVRAREKETAFNFELATPATVRSPKVLALQKDREHDYLGLLHPAHAAPVAKPAAAAKAAVKPAEKAPVKGALVQGGKVAQTPPGQFGEYKKHAGAGSVVAMLQGLITDANQLEKEAIAEENAAVAAYSAYVDESAASRAALMRKQISADERRAALEIQVGEDKRSVDELTADLEALSDEKGQLHKACDFVQQNFDLRQAARSQELEALAQAKAILSGAGR